MIKKICIKTKDIKISFSILIIEIHANIIIIISNAIHQWYICSSTALFSHYKFPHTVLPLCIWSQNWLPFALVIYNLSNKQSIYQSSNIQSFYKHTLLQHNAHSFMNLSLPHIRSLFGKIIKYLVKGYPW